MLKINRTLEYALMALKYMNHKKKTNQLSLTSAKEISESLGISFDTTAKVMQFMAQDGILKVEHGASGGYSFRKDLKEISLGDLAECVEGPISLVKCLNRDKELSCEIKSHCSILTPIQIINTQLSEFCHSLNLGDLLASSSEEKIISKSKANVYEGI